MEKEQLQSPEYWDELLQACKPVDDFLVFKTFGNGKDSSIYYFHANDSAKLDRSDEENSAYLVPSSLIERWGSAMDIVYPHSKRCCCFTKSYYRYVKGTGSLLATVQLCNARKQTVFSVEVVAPLLQYLFINPS